MIVLKPVFPGSSSDSLVEYGGEVGPASEAQPPGDLRDCERIVGQQLLGLFDSLACQVLVRSQPGGLLEEPCEMVGAQLHQICHGAERNVFVQVGSNVVCYEA